MQQPVISVIIPTYNRLEFLWEAIDSVRNQTVQVPVEIIVVDDGSKIDIGGPVTARYPDVRFIRQENLGLPYARQAGSDAALGEFIVYNDDDDLFAPEKLKIQHDFMTQYPELGVTVHDIGKMTPEGMLPTTSFQDHPYLWDCHPRQISTDPPCFWFEPRQFTPALLKASPFPPQTLMLRREYLKKVGGWNVKIRRCGEDVEFGVRASFYGPVGFINLPLTTVRRKHGGNMSDDVMGSYIGVVTNLAEFGPSYPPELSALVAEHLGAYYARLGWMGYNEGRFAEAAKFYGEAHKRGFKNLSTFIKYNLARLRAGGAKPTGN